MDNIFNLLPLEILRQIILLLERKSIKYMFQVLPNNTYLNLDEILETRKISSFPRINGKCLIHNVPFALYNTQIVKDDNKLIPKASLFRLRREEAIIRRKSALEYLGNIDADIVMGDLVIFDLTPNDICIFDGLKIKRFQSDELYPKIENDTPFDYWNQGGYKFPIWFNYNHVRDQCLTNIQSNIEKDENIQIFTCFIYNDISYKIISDKVTGSCIISNINDIQEILLENGHNVNDFINNPNIINLNNIRQYIHRKYILYFKTFLSNNNYIPFHYDSSANNVLLIEIDQLSI